MNEKRIENMCCTRITIFCTRKKVNEVQTPKAIQGVPKRSSSPVGVGYIMQVPHNHSFPITPW